jgi:8-oxo-dGTP pyrophosphatase MutT (NUDIX family)
VTGGRKKGAVCFQSAVIPFRENDGRLQVLMVTSRKSGRWVFPKGSVRSQRSARDVGIRRALAEAGVSGIVAGSPIGSYRYRSKKKACTVEVYVMEVQSVLDQWPQSRRKREWVPVVEALARTPNVQLRELIQSLPDYIAAAQLKTLISSLPDFPLRDL